ncbi:MAG: hypothetical protein C4519_19445 [Desulfobacteraceae bacterium]|nr:MAG: hypothetical protein C4519_19445 [Desulfobacteraceae bacterium]
MGQGNRFAPFVVLFISFVVLQAILAAVDSRQTPAKAARAFIKEYFYLDPDMQKWLCTEKRNAGMVEDFLQVKADQAAQQGYEISYFRHMFTKMHVNTIGQEADSARVQISGTTRVAINPVFMVIGKLFNLGQNHPMDVTLDLVKQNGHWRVCDIVPN